MIQRVSSGSQLKNRVDWVDVAKGLGIIFVVLGHLPISGQKSNMALMHHALYLFHMPLLLILSGYPLKEGLTVLGRTSLSILALHMLFIKHLEFIGLPFLSATIAIGISVCFHYLMLPYLPLRTVFGGRQG